MDSQFLPTTQPSKYLKARRRSHLLLLILTSAVTTSSEETSLDVGLPLPACLQLRPDQQTRPGHQPRLLHQRPNISRLQLGGRRLAVRGVGGAQSYQGDLQTRGRCAGSRERLHDHLGIEPRGTPAGHQPGHHRHPPSDQVGEANNSLHIDGHCRAAVGSEVEIILDCGVQRGTDIVKALALGADGVGIGKPYLYGLAAGGTQGVDKVMTILKVEMERAMGLLGVGSIQELKQNGHKLIKRRALSSRDGYGARYSKSGII